MIKGHKRLSRQGEYFLAEALREAQARYEAKLERRVRYGPGSLRRAKTSLLREQHMARFIAGAYIEVVE